MGMMSDQLGMRMVETLGGAHRGNTHTKEASQVTEVAEFVRLCQNDDLVTTVLGRKLKLQPSFVLQTEVKDCESFMERVTKLTLDEDLSEAYYYEPRSP